MFFKDEYNFLSNFYLSRFLYHGTFWRSVEHAFQAAKCKDLEMNEYIHSLELPAEAKKIGRKVELRLDWEDVKIGIMADLILCKFTQNEELKNKLLKTNSMYLEEGNWWHDNFWGNCYCDKCKDTKGENILGIILIEVREYIKENETKVVLCKKESYDIYIGRPPKWGNPFPITKFQDRDMVCNKFEKWLDGKVDAPNGQSPPTREDIKKN